MIRKSDRRLRMTVKRVPLRTLRMAGYWRIDCPCCGWHGWRGGRVQALNRARMHAELKHRRDRFTVAR